ncbi:hypothetical protein TrVE_jg6193 [Triparma verrucosa]|uniref:USP8 dimerisation domain-containing protein n=1 Tax=Triparma verrucosa TaxID=1606542 RepID=A0A9W7BTD7_9STRA|nr:hypothetical protein TrVE_jg6193 [Triparma verrucosa]
MPSSSRPSDSRRSRLKSQIPSPVVSDHYPIKNYYDLSSKLLTKFLDSSETSDLDAAYIFARRYMHLVTEVIPKHGYYNSSAFRSEKSSAKQNMKLVMEELEKIVDVMDVEEAAKREELEKKRREAARERERLEQEKKRIDDQAAAELELPSAPTFTPGTAPVFEVAKNLEETKISNESKYEGYGYDIPTAPTNDPSAPMTENEGSINLPPPSYEVVTSDSLASLTSYTPTAPPPPPPLSAPSHPPPSFSSLTPSPPAHHQPPPSKPLYPIPQKPAPITPMSQLKRIYTSSWITCKKSKKASVYALDTYQGRLSSYGKNSTNGCTVIAPLIAVEHLKSSGGVSDASIENVIDIKAGPHLINIRTKLGLSQHALIIPSDVHDHFVDEKVMRQDTFVGATGGNILDEEHVGELIKCLNDSGDKKSAAALFYHAHVICIVKMRVGKEVWYDLIDSLPFQHEGNKQGGARIRCKDAETLATCIRWYSSAKLTSSDIDFVDRNEWDENMCDFDPRVFQSFVWAEK